MSTKRPSPRMMAMLTDVAANNGGTLRNRDQHLVTTRAAVEGHGWVTVDRGTPDNRGGIPSEYRYTLTDAGLAVVTAAGVTITPTPTPTDMDRTALVTAHQLRLMKKGFTEREALAVAMQKATMGLPVPSDSTPASSPDQPTIQASKTLGEMAPTERLAAARRAATRLQNELVRTAPALVAVLDGDQSDSTSTDQAEPADDGRPPFALPSTDRTWVSRASFTVFSDDDTDTQSNPQRWASSTSLADAAESARKWSHGGNRVSVYGPEHMETPTGAPIMVFVGGALGSRISVFEAGQHVDARRADGAVVSGDIVQVYDVRADRPQPIYLIAPDADHSWAARVEVEESDIIGISVVMGDATAEVRQARDGEPSCPSCAQWVPVTAGLLVRPHRRDDSLTREWCRGEGRTLAYSCLAGQLAAYDPRCGGCGEPWRLLASGAVGHADGGRAHGCAAGPGDPVDRAMVAYWSLRPWQRARVGDDVAAAIVRSTLGAPCGICNRPGRVGDDGRLVPHAGTAGWCRGGGQPPVGSCAAGTYRVAYLTLRPAHMANAEAADLFRARGLTAREAAGYANNNFNPAEAADWHAAGFGPHEAPAFADLGHTPAEAVALVDATFADV